MIGDHKQDILLTADDMRS